MPPKVARLAGLGAYAACVFFVLVFAYVFYISRHTALGGMMWALSAVTYISMTLVLVALIAVHVVLARQLLYIASGGGPREV